MAKQRIEGKVRGSNYVILAPDGGVMKEVPLADARADSKLAAAIARNGWEGLPSG